MKKILIGLSLIVSFSVMAEDIGHVIPGETITSTKFNEVIDQANDGASSSLIVDSITVPTKCVATKLSGDSYKVSYVPVDCTTKEEIGLQQRDDAYEIGSGLNLLSCQEYQDHVLYTGQGDGSYWIDPDGAGPISEHVVLCDMDDISGFGWTLIFSSQTASGTADKGTLTPHLNLATLTPVGSMLSVYTPYSSVSALKFSCDGGKTGLLNYEGIQSASVIYEEIKNSATGFIHCNTTTLDSGHTMRWQPAWYDDASDPDFNVGLNIDIPVYWGTMDGYPSSGPTDMCNGVSYKTRAATAADSSTSDAYFYIWVR